MTYSEKITKRILNSDQWPSFSRPDFLTDLEKIAYQSYKSSNTSGYLAAILIYHQLCEEMIWLLIECSDFFIQLSVFPAEIHFARDKGLMFGQLLKKLNETIDFPNKTQFFSNCKEMNTIRVKIVHKLTEKPDMFEIEKLVNNYKELFDPTTDIFVTAYEEYIDYFRQLKNDREWTLSTKSRAID